jgi:aminomethyltransferase
MAFFSPFHERMSALNDTWKYKEWAGIVSPCRYQENHIYEYTAFRQATGVLDVSPLYKYDLRGPDAAALLSYVTTRDVSKLKVGRVTYLCWCDDAGHVIDDGTVTRTGEHTYRMTAADPQYAWLLRHAEGFNVTLEDVSRKIAALAVQGPTSRDVLKACSDMGPLAFFGSSACQLAGKSVRISRTGYTGDLGYEVWCDVADALPVWDAIMHAGKAYGIVPAGLDALDMSRIEAGFILLGVDYFSALHTTLKQKKTTPFELGLGATVELERAPFVGQQALRRSQPSKVMVGLELDWPTLESMYSKHDMAPALSTMASRDSLPIYLSGEQVGRVSSSTWSPTLKKYLALGSLRAEHARIGTTVEVEHTVLYERRTVPARVVERPFFNPERKRKP